MSPRTVAAAVLALALAASAVARERPVPPPFLPELEPLVGTWKRLPPTDKDRKGKEPVLHLVIKEEEGKLRLRYQLPLGKKVYDSDWDGNIEVDLQVNMTEYHEATLTVAAEPPRIDVREHIHYGGTWRDRETTLESSYELDDKGRLLLRCRSLRIGDKEYPCPQPLVYERVSRETKWDF